MNASNSAEPEIFTTPIDFLVVHVEDFMLSFDIDKLHEICQQLTYVLCFLGTSFAIFIGFLHAQDYF